MKLVEVRREDWSQRNHDPYSYQYQELAEWRNLDFVVHVYLYSGGMIRISAHRRQGRILEDGQWRWLDGIAWDELQEIKRAIGYGDVRAYEVYPEEEHVINRQNTRHLFIPSDRRSFGFYNDHSCDCNTSEQVAVEEYA